MIRRLTEAAEHADARHMMMTMPHGTETRAYEEIVRAVLRTLRRPDMHHPMFEAPARNGVSAGDYTMAPHEAQGAWDEILGFILEEP